MNKLFFDPPICYKGSLRSPKILKKILKKISKYFFLLQTHFYINWVTLVQIFFQKIEFRKLISEWLTQKKLNPRKTPSYILMNYTHVNFQPLKPTGYMLKKSATRIFWLPLRGKKKFVPIELVVNSSRLMLFFEN